MRQILLNFPLGKAATGLQPLYGMGDRFIEDD
jgi:hypothetical protein